MRVSLCGGLSEICLGEKGGTRVSVAPIEEEPPRPVRHFGSTRRHGAVRYRAMLRAQKGTETQCWSVPRCDAEVLLQDSNSRRAIL